ncbi:MAG: sortase [Rubrobacteraceae bacterium]
MVFDFKSPAILAALATLLLAILALTFAPVVPLTQTASADLRPAPAEEEERELLDEGSEVQAPSDESTAGSDTGTISLTVPKLDLEDVAVPVGSSQEELDREGIIRLKETGVPWQEGSNTFIVGHALGFMQTRVPYVFYDLDEMQPGDEILVENEAGDEYTFRVYDYMTVRPADYWVTYPVEGKTIISLQTCTPVPTFENRLIVRAELVS